MHCCFKDIFFYRSTFTECEPEGCNYKERCGNQRIQRRQYAPGLERFMTLKKGWGVRARQSIARSAFILEYTGEICSSAEFEKRMVTRYRGDSHHYCLGLDSKTMIGTTTRQQSFKLSISVGDTDQNWICI